MYKPAHYLILFFIIVFGVAVGNLLYSAVTAQYLSYQAGKAAEQLAQQAEIERQQLDAEQRQRKQQLRQQRIDSVKGRQLHRACLDWENAYTA